MGPTFFECSKLRSSVFEKLKTVNPPTQDILTLLGSISRADFGQSLLPGVAENTPPNLPSFNPILNMYANPTGSGLFEDRPEDFPGARMVISIALHEWSEKKLLRQGSAISRELDLRLLADFASQRSAPLIMTRVRYVMLWDTLCEKTFFVLGFTLLASVLDPYTNNHKGRAIFGMLVSPLQKLVTDPIGVTSEETNPIGFMFVCLVTFLLMQTGWCYYQAEKGAALEPRPQVNGRDNVLNRRQQRVNTERGPSAGQPTHGVDR